jgi:hypothetical protein
MTMRAEPERERHDDSINDILAQEARTWEEPPPMEKADEPKPREPKRPPAPRPVEWRFDLD